MPMQADTRRYTSAVARLQRGASMGPEDMADMRINRPFGMPGAALACLLCIANATFAAEPPAPPDRSSRDAAAAEDLPYGTGYEAREAARVRQEARAASATPGAIERSHEGGRDRATARGQDRPRSDSRPPRPDRSR